MHRFTDLPFVDLLSRDVLIATHGACGPEFLLQVPACVGLYTQTQTRAHARTQNKAYVYLCAHTHGEMEVLGGARRVCVFSFRGESMLFSK